MKEEKDIINNSKVKYFCRLLANAVQVIHDYRDKNQTVKVIISFDPLTVPEGEDTNFNEAKKIIFKLVKESLDNINNTYRLKEYLLERIS